MIDKLSTVKIDKRYHHGDLRTALLAAASALLEEKGVEGFSLREVARRAGVSPAAPKHHFPDVRALLTAIATKAFEDLADLLEAASADASLDRATRIRRQGIAYVAFALEQSARFDLIWRKALLDTTNPEHRRAGDRAFAAIDRLARGEDAPSLERTDPRMAPTIAAWAIVHGYARLAIEGSLGPRPAAMERASAALVIAVLDHLSP